ncbi:MAG: serine hydrolase [Bacteroidetes bacterium]|nr:serine hydrolase [Bacteroidota bacterium]
MRVKILWVLLLFLLFRQWAYAGSGLLTSYYNPLPDSCWADSVFWSLSLEEKIGQLIFVRANKDNTFLPEIPELITKYNIGGVVFFKGSPVRQALTTNSWQKLAKTPLFVTIDAERGLAMRLDSTFGFPYMMTLGAARDDSLVYLVSSEIARGCRRLGIHINFGPVVDINSNPRNPVINSRSFGENKYRVTRKGFMYMKGLQDNHIMHTAKHFPGHGDTDSDSHLTLPTVRHSAAWLESVDLFPYYQLIPEGLEGVMVAHLYVPAVDSAKNAASSLSKPVITGLLREKMGFRGLVFTDALEMKGVTGYSQPGDLEVKALIAGNDVLLMPLDIPKAIHKIKQAIDSCWIWPEEIDDHVMKILRFKQKYIPVGNPFVDTTHLVSDLNPVSNQVLYRKIISSAATLLKNTNHLLPLINLDTLSIATLCLGTNQITGFQEMLGHYAHADHFTISNSASQAQIDSLLEILKKYNLVIAGIVNTSIYAEKYFGLSSNTLEFLSCLNGQNHSVLVLFGNPYAIEKLHNLENTDALLVGYQDNPETYEILAQAIFGAFPLNGNLPVSASPVFPSGAGLETPALPVLQYCLPEEAGINSADLTPIDSLIRVGLKELAYPGCEVLLAWKGKVVYHKAFGKPTYQDSLVVKPDDIYDLASLTKVAATTLAIMKLTEEGKIDPDEKLSTYLPYLKNSNKKNIIIRDIMTHQARLKPWIPFYSKVIKNGKPDTMVFRPVQDSVFCIVVAKDLYMRKDYLDSIRQAIVDSPLEKKTDYKYSDLGFFLLKEAVEIITRMPLEVYVDNTFYKPLGLSTMGFKPLLRFPAKRIIPTEEDTVFRQQLIRGYVHDPGAAMLGGVSGHAGLFSDANDLGIIMQMLINGGVYGGNRYFKEETINEFTSVQSPELQNRRGLGFDKPLFVYIENGPSCKSASLSSFGHSGFTGTYIWADPVKEVVFVFLSNRVNPSASNHKLSDMNIRTNIHEYFYKAVEKAEIKP